MSKEAKQHYKELYIELLNLIGDNKDETEQGDCLRDEMDLYWHQMTQSDITEIMDDPEIKQLYSMKVK